MQDQRAELDWREGGIPVSTRFDDPYFSLENGLAETNYVFLDGNGLPDRFRDGFHIAELGFGTGLNLLATVRAWRDSGQTGTLHYTTFEAFPMSGPEMVRAQRAFPEIADLVEEFSPYWPAERLSLPGLEFRMILGDARNTLPDWLDKADAWFLDGFSPAKNPELWDGQLMKQVHDHTNPNGSAATYTAAGFVRRGLQDAGFQVERRAGYGRKRHMTIARKAN